jgi:lysophospholipase L1-like esterase
MFVLILIQSCGPGAPGERAETVSSDSLTFLALGDSYTIGESVDSASRWPVQLVNALRADGWNVEDPLVIARTGWTTAELAAGIEERRPEGPFDLVSLLIGVNNQYRGLPLEEYRMEFSDLLHTAVTLAGGDEGKVLVVSIPDWGVTPFARDRNREEISSEIDAFNDAARSVCEDQGVAFVSVTEVSRRASTETALVAEDGLHPSGAMYGLWVEAVLPEVRRILGGG